MKPGSREINKNLLFYVINKIVVINTNPRIIWQINMSDLADFCLSLYKEMQNSCQESIFIVLGKKGKVKEKVNELE